MCYQSVIEIETNFIVFSTEAKLTIPAHSMQSLVYWTEIETW